MASVYLRMASSEHQAADTIVLATGNPGKVREMRAILAELGYTLLTSADFRDVPRIIEDAPTLEGNARKKAETVARATGLPAVGDDTGLEVHALSGEPGVQSARYAGPDCDAARNRKKLLSKLAGLSDRSARFRTVVALAVAGQTHVFEGVCEGTITSVEKGDGGFGYDAIFIPVGSNLTFAEMTPAEKDHVSHRARALAALKNHINELGLIA